MEFDFETKRGYEEIPGYKSTSIHEREVLEEINQLDFDLQMLAVNSK